MSATAIRWSLIVVLWASGLAGCRAAHRFHSDDYAALASVAVRSPQIDGQFESYVNPVVPELAGPHAVEDYIRFALSQNPRIQAARKAVEAKDERVPQEASLADPTFSAMGWPSAPHSMQIVGGRMTAEMTVAQTVPWRGTLQAQAAAAARDADVARAQLAAVELDIVANVKKVYYELYYIEQALRITADERKSLDEFVEIAEAKFRAGKASQQDVLQAQLEVSSVDAELIRLRQMLASTQATLNRQLHVSPETNVRTQAHLPSETLPADLERLYSLAVQARPELHAALAAIERDRERVELAHLKYFPDINLSTGWATMTTNRAMSPLADGRDNWTIGLMVNLPIYRKRLDAAVREAEAMVVAGAREYDALRDETLEAVKDQFSQAQSQQDLLRLFGEDIVPKARQALTVSITAYQVGQVDFQQLLDNWRQVLRFELAQQRLESQLRQSLAMLERTLGGLSSDDDATPLDYCPAPPLPYTGYDDCPPSIARSRYSESGKSP